MLFCRYPLAGPPLSWGISWNPLARFASAFTSLQFILILSNLNISNRGFSVRRGGFRTEYAKRL
jgi:hypothetical protein